MELQDIYDKNGKKTGKIIERGKEATQPGEYTLFVDIWIMNKKNEFLISKRAPGKWRAGKWESIAGGSISGEDSLTAALREANEELGIALKPENGKMINRLFKNDGNPKDGGMILDVWFFRQDIDINDIVFQPNETDGAMWATTEDILQLVDNDSFLFNEREPYEELFKQFGL